jgi:hypothetical protein
VIAAADADHAARVTNTWSAGLYSEQFLKPVELRPLIDITAIARHSSQPDVDA